MKANLLKLLLFVAAIPLVYLAMDRWLAPEPPPSSINQEARDFRLPGFQLSSLRGKPVVLHFWATWCGPCVQELPELLRLARSRRDLEFVAVAEDKDEATLDRFFLSHPELEGIRKDLHVLLDPEGAAAAVYGSERFPETFLLTRSFRIDNHLIGPQRWSGSMIQPLLQRLQQ